MIPVQVNFLVSNSRIILDLLPSKLIRLPKFSLTMSTLLTEARHTKPQTALGWMFQSVINTQARKMTRRAGSTTMVLDTTVQQTVDVDLHIIEDFGKEN